MYNAIKKGTEVFIISNNEIFKGIIIGSYRMEKTSKFIINDYRTIYTVLTENNYKLDAVIGEDPPHPSIFFTKEGCIDYLNAKIMKNNKEISEMQKQNNKYLEMIESLNSEKTNGNQKGLKRK